jgi:hypothetical protein
VHLVIGDLLDIAVASSKSSVRGCVATGPTGPAPGTAATRSEVFVHDSKRPGGSQIEQVSVGSDELPAAVGSSSQPSVSCDGRFVAFTSDAALDPDDQDGGAADVYVRDRLTGTTELASGGLPAAGADATGLAPLKRLEPHPPNASAAERVRHGTQALRIMLDLERLR